MTYHNSLKHLRYSLVLLLIGAFLTLTPLTVLAQTPVVTNGTPAESFAGEQFCFDASSTNTGAPGFGPYLRLIVPPDLTFDSAEFLGSGVTTTTVGTFPAAPGNELTDPRTDTTVTGPEGAELILLVLPLGSVVEGSPPLITEICLTIATAATVGVPLNVILQPIYEFGDTATGANGPIEGAAVTAPVTPTVVTLAKSQNAPEGEKPPGPAWPITYTLSVDVANGKSVFDLVLADMLPANLQFTGTPTIVGGVGCSAATTPSTLTPGGSLEVECNEVPGTAAGDDLTVSYQAYIIDILDEMTCGTQSLTNTVTLDAEHPDDNVLPQVNDSATVTAKHLPIQKGAAPSLASPGTTVTFTANFQVSEFATADSLLITDQLPDGYTFASHGSLTIGGGPVAIAPTVTANADGSTTVIYDVGALAGNLPPASDGVLTYTATIDEDFTPAPDPILASDSLTNNIEANYSLTDGAASCIDPSSATVGIQPVTLNKSIINPQTEYAPGDTVQFVLEMQIPSGDTENIVFEDFFPLPVFDVTGLNLTFGGPDIALGSSDTLGLTPTSITVDASTNALRITWPNVATTASQTLAVQINIDVEDVPFADNLFLSNLFRSESSNTASETATDLNPVQIAVRAPKLTVTKGISASNNATADATISPAPSVLPVDGDISASDAGDTVTYVITVENTGGAQAFDVTVSETPPAGLTGCMVSSVTDGSGTGLASAGNLFGAGLVLTNPLTANDDNPPGGGAPFTTDTALITYVCTVDSVSPRAEIINEASATWTSQASATPFPAQSDDATITIADPALAKAIDNLAPDGSGGAGITAGDTVTYAITVTLPEGTTPGLSLTDTLPAGLEYVNGSVAVDTTGFNGTVSTTPTVTSAGQNVSIDFGNVPVTNDNNAANNSFTVTLQALVLDDAANDGAPTAQTKTNNVSLNFTGNPGGAVTDQVNTDFLEPTLDVTKMVSPTPLDAGDTATITIQVANTGTSPAYDVVVTDMLDSNVFDLASVVAGTTPGNFSYSYIDPTVTYTMTSGTIAAGGSVTFTFTADLRDDVVTGSAFSNTATATGDSQDGTVTGERTTTDADTVSIGTAQSEVSKALAATSEDSTDPGDASLASNPPVAIGEVLDYTLTFTFPEGVTQNATLIDQLPAGLSFITGSATLERTSTNLTTANDPSSINSATVDDPISVTLVPGPGPGQVSLALGDVTNTDMDNATSENLVLKLQLVVANIASNSAGVDLDNGGRLTFDNALGANIGLDSTPVTVHVAEPDLNVNKSAAPLTAGGGDTVTFTVIVSNDATGTNAATAFDGTFSDNLPARYLTPTSPTIDLTNTAMIMSDVNASFSGNSLTGDFTALAPGESFEITYQATLDPNAQFGEPVLNTLGAAATSLPGGNGTGGVTPGIPGDADGERTAAGGVNNLTASGDATVTVSTPSLAKTTLNAQTRYAIGESVDFQITVGVPVGTTDNFVLTDVLDGGLSFDVNSLSVTLPMGASVTNAPLESNTAFFTLAGDTLGFDFGTITAPTAGNITLTYSATVENIAGNQNGVSLDNSASLAFDDPNGPGTLSAGPESTDLPATVGEPNLTLGKTITAGATGSDAGDTISWQITVENTGTTTAFQVNWSDQLPDGLFMISNPALAISGGDVFLNDTTTAPTNGDFSIATTVNTDDSLSLPALQIEAGATLTITFDSEVMNTVIAGDMLDNATRASFTSLVDGGRDNSSNPGAVDDDDDSDLDNYEDSASQMLTIGSAIAIDKTVDATSFAIGETAVFTLRVDVIEGVTPSTIVTDILPTGLSYVSHLITAGNMGISFGNAAFDTRLGTGQTVQFDFGDISNPANASDTDDFITIAITAQVDNSAGNQDGSILSNGEQADGSEVFVEFGSAPTPNRVDFDSDGGTPGIQGLPITLTEPDLIVSKTVDPVTQALGDVVTFTVEVQHSAASTADAFDLLLSDTLPVGLTYVPGSASLPAMDVSVSGQNLAFAISSLTLLDNNTSFTYQASVDSAATVGLALTNDLQLAWASTPGATGDLDDGRNGDDGSGGLNDYTANDSADVIPTASAFIDATKIVALAVDGGTAGVADPGDTLEYTVTLTNTGPDATGVVFSDTLPANTTYVASSLSASQGTVDDSSNPNLVVDIGAMTSSTVVTITFQVTVDAGTPAGTVISNQGSVDSDQTVPEPTDQDGADANGDQPTDITVGGQPPLGNALYVQKVVAFLVDADASGDVTPGDTMRYTLVFENRGAAALTNVSLTDTIPTGLTPVGASETISGGGNNITIMGPAVAVAIPTLNVGQSESASFDVTIDAPLAGSTETFTNQGVADSDQTDPTDTDSNGDPNDGNQPTAFTAVDGVTANPIVDVEKRWSLASDGDGDGLVDPGDTLEYRIAVSNTGAAIATDVRLDDSIPANTTIVAGSATASQGAVVGEDPLAVNIADINPGQVVVITFRVTVDGGTPDGTILSNQATASGANFANEASDDNGSDADGKNPTLTPVDTGGGGGTGAPQGLSKTLQASSEADSSGAEVLIGEVLTFRMAVEVPTGLLREVTLTDTLPAGLSYIAGSGRLARTFDTGLNASTNPGGVNGAASGTFVNLTDGAELSVAGQDLNVFLGDLINSDNDLNAETYTLEIQALVSNAVVNQAGVEQTNQAGLSYLDGLGQPQNLTPVDNTVTVIEPNLQIAKSADPAAILLTGGSVQFTVVVSNPQGGATATAYDIAITDTLPAAWAGLTVASITPAGGVSGITDNSAGSSIAVTVATFPPDGTLTIVYSATTTGPGTSGTLTNTAAGTWTSLPDAQGTGAATPGVPGAVDGERTGAGGVNDHATSGSADVAVSNPNLTKTVTNPQTRYAIGDPVSYQVTVDLPPNAVLDNNLFQDVLDQGLTYIAGSLAIEFETGLSASNSPADFTRTDNAPGTGQETLALDLGTLSNSTAATRTLTLRYQARVDNILSNQNNQGLDNTATLNFGDPGGPGQFQIDDGAGVTVGEPNLTLVKAVTSPTVGLDAGDTVSFRIEVGNTGSTTAFEVVLDDLLPVGLENPGNFQVTTMGGAETPTFSSSSTGWSSSGFDVPVGTTVTITFDAVLGTGVTPGQQLQNAVAASFTSLNGSTGDERDGSTAGSNQSDNSDLDNYNEDASSPIITVADPLQLDKRFHPDLANSTYTLGEIVTYRLTVAILEGTLSDLLLEDVLPPDVTFLDATVGLGNTGIITGYTPPPAQVGQTLSFGFGDVSNPANGNTADDFITIDIDARIDNVAANQAGTLLANNASLSFTGPGGTEFREFDADSGTPGIQGLELSVVEPALQLSKDAMPASVSLGDLVTVTLVLDHTVNSTADAFDIQVTDVLPAGLTFEPGSATPAPTVTGQTLSFDIPALTLLDDQLTISYQARVDLDAPVGAPLTNTALASYTTLPGADPDERTGTDGAGGLNDLVTDQDTATVTPNADAAIDATKTVALVSDADNSGTLTAGDTLEYQVTLSNANGALTGVVFSDTVPAETTYVGGSLSSSVGGENAAGAPTLVVAIGDMAAGEVVTIRFRVTVNALVASGVIISNQGSVDSDQTVPEPTDADGIDSNGDQPTNITVGATSEPGLRSTKVVALSNDSVPPQGTVNVGDTVTYTIIVTNTGTTALSNVQFSDTIPAQVTVTAVTNASQSGQSVTATIGALGVGESYTITITGTVNAAGVISNQGTVSSDQLTIPTDGNGNPDDGQQPTVIVAEEPGVAGNPELRIGKTASLLSDGNGDGLVNPGETIRFTLIVENPGSSPATNVLVNDTLPTNAVLVPGSVQTSQGSVVSTAPTLTINLGILAAAASATITFDMVVDATAGSQITNLAIASDDEGETVQDEVTVDIDAPRLLDPPEGLKTVDASGLPVLEWRMVWLNPSNTEALDVRVVDGIPASTSYVTGSVSCVASGASTVTRCVFDAASNQIIYEGSIAPDPGASGENDAVNEVVIVFRTTLDESVTSTENQGSAYWDDDGNGFVEDDITDGQIPVVSDDPATPEDDDPTVWEEDPVPIPTLSLWALLLLGLLLAMSGNGLLRQGTGYPHRAIAGK